MSRPKIIADWPLINWKKTTTALAAELGCSRTVVGEHRRIHAPSTCRKIINWKGVDWKAGNHEIAKLLGVKVGAVAFARHRLQAGKGRRKPGSGLWKQAWHKKGDA